MEITPQDILDIFEKEKRIYDKVKVIMEKVPECRDNYNLLLLHYWAYELNRKGIDDLNDLHILLRDNKVTSASTIQRMCRSVKEKHPELRGQNYKENKELEQAHRYEKVELKKYDSTE